jgi:amino acid transporter
MKSSSREAPADQFQAQLGTLDFTLLVIGAIVGDGIYVVGALGAQALGPAQLLAWVVAGVLAALIGLAFVQCAAIDHEVGGSYSYARIAFGPLTGFIAGWVLYIGEWTALSAFPIAFFNYFSAFSGVSDSFETPVKVALIVGATLVNLAGVKQGARTNDVLTAAKLIPLFLLIVLAIAFVALHFGSARANLQPFTPVGLGGFSTALLPIFWAYAGFELAVLPAGEVKSPEKTLPRGLLVGVGVSMVFYLLISLATAVAAPWQEVAASTHPLALVIETILTTLGGPGDAGVRLMSLGGLISIAGVCVVFTLALARLSYALSKDGFLPAVFAARDRRGTPYAGLLFEGSCALVFSTLFSLGELLSTAVLFLSVCYLLTSLSALRLIARNPQKALHVPGLRLLLFAAAASSAFLMMQASLTQLAVAGAVICAGLALYAFQSRHWHHGAGSQALDQPDPGPHHPHFWLRHSVRRTAP